MYKLIKLAPFSILISLSTLAGIVLHDTKVDKLASASIGLPIIAASTDNSQRALSTDPHTHVERVHIGNMRGEMPRIAPRYGEQKKHLMQKRVTRGTQAFDAYCIPVIA